MQNNINCNNWNQPKDNINNNDNAFMAENIVNEILRTGKNLHIPCNHNNNDNDGSENMITIHGNTMIKICKAINYLHAKYVKDQNTINFLTHKIQTLEIGQSHNDKLNVVCFIILLFIDNATNY